MQRDDVASVRRARLDHNLTGASRLTARYSLTDRGLLEPFAGAGFSSIPGFGNDVARRGQNLRRLQLDPGGSAFVNDIRFGYNRVPSASFPRTRASTNASVGLPALATNPRDAGLSLISVAGYSPLGHEYNNPQESTSDTLPAQRHGDLRRAARTWSSSAASGTASGSRRIATCRRAAS